MDVIALEDLAAAIPNKLADVIRRPGLCSLRLATEHDLAALPEVAPIGGIKRVLTDWYVLAVIDERSVAKALLSLTLFGTSDGETWNTSSLVGRGPAYFVTHSGSTYQVAGPASPEPDLPYICGWLNYLGIGKALGVLPIFL